MSRHSTSFLFLVGMGSMCAVWVTMPYWGYKRRPAVDSIPKTRSVQDSGTGFLHARPDRTSFMPPADGGGGAYSREQIQRQLDRRHHMEQSGFVRNVIENQQMPEEVRRRFQKEKARLDQLAEAYPELAGEAEKKPIPRKLADDGSFSPRFKEAADLMQSSGAWDELHRTFLRQLQEAADDETLPPRERPQPEEIEAVRSGRLIPVR